MKHFPKMTSHPNLSPTAFWDADMTTLDYQVSARFVIEKVINYGLWADILEILRCYLRSQTGQGEGGAGGVSQKENPVVLPRYL